MKEQKQSANVAQYYKSCRSGILLISLFTAINIFLIIFNVNYTFIFSAIFPQIIVAVGVGLTSISGENIFYVISLIISIVLVLVFFMMFFISKNKLGGMITALVIFSLDTAFTIYFTVVYYDPAFIMCIIFHALALIDLIQGVITGSKLKKYPNGLETTPEEIYKTENENVLQTLEKITVTPDLLKEASTPIGDYKYNGIDRIAVICNSSEIKLVETPLQIVLVIDGKIYDQVGGVSTMSQFTLQATINGITYKVCQKNKGLRGILTLYANDEVLATAKRWR